MPLSMVVTCEEPRCDGKQFYDKQTSSFAPCSRCGKGAKSVVEWLNQQLDDREFSPGGRLVAIAWLTERRETESDEEQRLFASLTDEDCRIIGEYSDIRGQNGIVAANVFLKNLPHKPSPAVEKLMLTSRLLHITADRGRRQTPVDVPWWRRLKQIVQQVWYGFLYGR